MCGERYNTIVTISDFLCKTLKENVYKLLIKYVFNNVTKINQVIWSYEGLK